MYKRSSISKGNSSEKKGNMSLKLAADVLIICRVLSIPTDNIGVADVLIVYIR